MTDEDLVQELELRIDELDAHEESTKADIGNQMLTPDVYLENVKAYAQREMKNFKAAKKAGVDAENLEFIKQRLNLALKELEEAKPKMTDALASIAKKDEEFKANHQKQISQAMKISNAPKIGTELDDMVDMYVDQAHPNP